MPDTVQHVQARHLRRCVVVANGNMRDLVVAALNVQAAGRGDAIKAHIMGVRVVTASGGFTVSNVDGTGSITIATTIVPYDIAACEGMSDTALGGGANLGVEVYYTGNPTVP